jgi:uncharacterized membrane protein YfcA
MPIHDLSPWLLLVAPIIIIVAYTVFGLSGFGSTVISVPVLAHFLPVSYLVPLMALLDLASAAFIGSTNREHVAKSEMKRIIPPMFVGFLIGATLLVGVPDAYLKTALGIFAMAVGLYSIVNPVMARTISSWWSIPAGIVGGALATVFGAGGPIYATYLSGRLKDKTEIRSTMSTLISISAFSRAVLYAITGLILHVAIFAGFVVLAPFVWVGLKIGDRIHVGLTQTQMRRVVGCILLGTGGSLIVRVFFQG